jgi:hypothetical protein
MSWHPDTPECGGVLGTVKAMPFGWPLIATSLDPGCARRL